ncbi:MAG: hypothetical protein L0L70_11865, partial [Lactococcus lactis]|nr:hypothetical protein [Lactococcus lactis]
MQIANFGFFCGLFWVTFFSEKRTVYGFEFWSFCEAKSAGFDLDFQGDKRGRDALFLSGNGQTFAEQNVCHSDSLQYLFFNVRV